jgi:hypothetical protein
LLFLFFLFLFFSLFLGGLIYACSLQFHRSIHATTAAAFFFLRGCWIRWSCVVACGVCCPLAGFDDLFFLDAAVGGRR